MTSTDDIPEPQYFPGVVSPSNAVGSGGRRGLEAYRFQMQQSQPIVISSMFSQSHEPQDEGMEVTSNLMIQDQLNASHDEESNGLVRPSNKAFSARYRPPPYIMPSGKPRTSQNKKRVRRVLKDHQRQQPESSSFSVVKLMHHKDSLALHPVSAADAFQKQVQELQETIDKQTQEPVALP